MGADVDQGGFVERATGGKGDKGDKGDAGGPGLTWRGIWAIGIQYHTGDVVYRNGSSFVALQDNIGSEPTGFNSVWSFLAERGQDGQDGIGEGGGWTYSSPYSGNDNQELGLAIKDMDASRIDPNCHYFVSQLIAGLQQPDGKYQYVVKIHFINPGIANVAGGNPFLEYSALLSQRMTGLAYLNLSSTNPNVWGHMSIDFSKLEAGGVYQNDTFVAGALFGIVVPGTSVSSGSGTGIVTASIPNLNKDSGDALTVDGSSKTYIFNDETQMVEIYIAEDVKGEFTIINLSSSYNFNLSAMGEKQINGKDVIAVSPGNFVTVIPNLDSFAAIGVIVLDV